MRKIPFTVWGLRPVWLRDHLPQSARRRLGEKDPRTVVARSVQQATGLAPIRFQFDAIARDNRGRAVAYHYRVVLARSASHNERLAVGGFWVAIPADWFIEQTA